MRIEVEERKANIVSICDVCKVTLTRENRANRAHKDQRYGIMTGLELTILISSNEYTRGLGKSKVIGKPLDGETDLCRKCHRDVIQWYLDHLEVEDPS